MNFTPLGNRIVVKQTNAVEITKGGILLPENAQRKPLEGEVIAVGPGWRSPDGEMIGMDVTVGDYVLVSPGSATEIKIGNDKYLILPETDILGIFNGS